VREHRIIWEEINKACLLRWGIVHHINNIKSDNRIENLFAMSSREHKSLHGKTGNLSRAWREIHKPHIP
jgi:hypothetical protein